MTIKQVVGLILLLLLVSSFLTFLFMGYTRAHIPEYVVGDIARSDVVVPMDVFIEDEEATKLKKADAREKVLPVYRFDASKGASKISAVSGAFTTCRQYLETEAVFRRKSIRREAQVDFKKLPDPVRNQIVANLSLLGKDFTQDKIVSALVAERFSPSLENQLAEFLKTAYSTPIVVDEQRLVPGKTSLRAIKGTGEEAVVQLDEVLTLSQAREKAGESIKRSEYPADSKPLLQSLVGSLLEPNLAFDFEATQARQEQAVGNVDPVLRKLKKGKIIVRQGDEIRPDHLSQFQAIRNARTSEFSVARTSGTGLLIATLLLFLGIFLRTFSRTQRWSYVKQSIMISVVLLSNILLLKMFWFIYESVSHNFVASPLSEKTHFFFALPFAFGAMLVALLGKEHMALIFSVFFCVLAGLAVETDFLGYVYIFLSNLVGILLVRKATQRIAVVGSGFRLGLVAVGLFTVIQISRQAPLDLSVTAFGAGLALLSGPITGGLLVFTMPLCERLFMVATEIQLSELGNLNLPLIRGLILRAPGTYNHSIAVGTLAEGAAKAIGLNPLFLRVACLYHDIGKSVHPEYFVENQKEVNIHEQISPQESVKMLVAHVTEGIQMARAANLPPLIVDIIPQHHGTKLATFFFEKAKRQAGLDTFKINEEDFRYPGPKPQSREAAIIMLADAVEAAARTLQDHSQEKLLELIQKIVATTAEDGQFSECEITLAEIDLITFSFLETLSSIYHSRITYPGFDFDQKQVSKKVQARAK